MPERAADPAGRPLDRRALDAEQLDALMIALARRLRTAVVLLDARRRDGRLDSLTLRLVRDDGVTLEIDVAHVETFEASTWEPAPPDLASLVGARGHTLHASEGSVGFRLATWTDEFAAERMALAIERRLAAEPGR